MNCSIPECNRKTIAIGLCGMHYQRKKKTGTTDLIPTPSPPPCSVEGCLIISCKKGLCDKHYQRQWKTGSTDIDPPLPTNTHCSVEGCPNTPRSRTAAYCEKHYYRVRRVGETELPVRDYKRVDQAGYRINAVAHPVLNTEAGNKPREHRVVLYDLIGPGSHPCFHCGVDVSWEKTYPQDHDGLVVDHLDSDRANNDPSNLVPSCAACNLRRGLPKMKATRRQQNASVTYLEETLCITEWAERVRISPMAFKWRLNNGWSVAEAVTTPRGVTGPLSQKYA